MRESLSTSPDASSRLPRITSLIDWTCIANGYRELRGLPLLDYTEASRLMKAHVEPDETHLADPEADAPLEISAIRASLRDLAHM